MKVNFEKIDKIIVKDDNGNTILSFYWGSIKVVDCQISGKYLEIKNRKI